MMIVARAHRRWVMGVWAATLLLVPAVLVAKPAKPSTAKQRARAHYAKGEKLYRQGRFERAIEAYKRALDLERQAAYMFNIAQCYRELGQPARARFYFRLYLAEAPRAPNREAVRREIRRLERQSEKLARSKGRLGVVSRPSGASIHINAADRKPAGKAPQLLTLKAGEYLVVLRLAGHRIETRRVRVRAGKTTSLDVVLRPRTIARHVPVYKRWWFWTGLSLSAALAAGAVATGVLALRQHDAWKDPATADPDAVRRRGLPLRTATDVLWSLSAATALSLIVGSLIVSARGRRDEKKTAVTASPACSARFCGVVVGGGL